MKKFLFKAGIVLAVLSVLVFSGCDLTSQIATESWESVSQYELVSSGTTLITGAYEITFVDETNYRVELKNAMSTSTSVYATQVGTYAIDGSTITFTSTSTTYTDDDTNVSAALAQLEFEERGLFPLDGEAIEYTIEKKKYRILLLSYDAIYLTDADGNEKIYTLVE